jgi:hypothetical protein
VSDASEEIELSRLERAAEFMRGVRLTQRGRGRFGGANYLAPETKRAITEALDNSALVAAVKKSAQADLPVNWLAERFEEMCRRQGTAVDVELRPSVVKLLALELWINNIALGEPGAEQLLAVTMRQGAIAPELLREFAEYPRYMVTTAMRGWASEPRDMLLRANKEIMLLSAEPEFQRVAPSILRHHAINSPLDVRARLRKLAENHSEGEEKHRPQTDEPGHSR